MEEIKRLRNCAELPVTFLYSTGATESGAAYLLLSKIPCKIKSDSTWPLSEHSSSIYRYTSLTEEHISPLLLNGYTQARFEDPEDYKSLCWLYPTIDLFEPIPREEVTINIDF